MNDVFVMMVRLVLQIHGFVLENVKRVLHSLVAQIVPIDYVVMGIQIVTDQIISLVIAMMNSVILVNFVQMVFPVPMMKHFVLDHVR